MSGQFTSTIERARANAEHLAGTLAFTLLPDGETEAAHLTHRELDERARAVAGRLQRELRPGERALLLYPTSLDFVTAFFGCLYAGIIAVPVVEPVKQHHLARIKHIAADARAATILTSAPLMDRWQKWIAADPELQTFRWITTDQVAPAEAADWHMPTIAADTLAFLQYTSGSTGLPRGVMVTHGNLTANCEMQVQVGKLSGDTLVLGWLPLFHDMGLISQVVMTAHLGNRSVLMPPIAFLQRPMRWLKAISRYGAYLSSGPDFAYALAARKATPAACEGLDLSSWRLAPNGAEPVRAATVRAFTETFGPYGFRPTAMRPCYGLAEATLMVAFNHEVVPTTLAVDAAAFERKRSVPAVEGQAALTLVGCGTTELGNQVVRIVDPETREVCAPGTVGEIWVAGDHVAAGYWQQPELSDVTFCAQVAGTGEGPFLRTGDLGFVHEGQLYVAGRLKDLIILDGTNHFPQDLEQTVEAAHPAVRRTSTAAFSVDRDGQERLVVVAELDRTLADAGPVDAAQAAQAVRAALSAEHGVRLDDLVFIRPRTILKTSSGKIQRRACRAAYLNHTLERW